MDSAIEQPAAYRCQRRSVRGKRSNGGLWLRGDISAFRAGATPKILVPLMLALCHDCAVVRPGVFR